MTYASTVLLHVAYDGRPFSGFVRQANGHTVAGALDDAIRTIDPEASLVRCTSRTDAGVHALAQPTSFDTHQVIAPRGWVLALNQQLPKEIAVVRAAHVRLGYDPRRHAKGKIYRYVVLESPVPDPFLAGRAWRVHDRLNQQLMQHEALALVGRHDFAAFRGASDPRTDTVRHIVRVEVRTSRSDPRCTLIEVEGDRFLYKMVRIIAGALVDVGRGRLQPGATSRALQSAARTALGITAPPDGLYLVQVELESREETAWPETLPIIDDLPGLA